MLLLFWLLALTLTHTTYAWLPQYHLIKHPNQFYCNEVSHIHTILNNSEHANKLFVVWYTHDVTDSPYLIIYFEYIWTLLSDLDNLHIILDIKTHQDAIVNAMLYDFPKNTLYIAIADSKASINPCMLSYIRMNHGYPPPVLFHLNHENPW